MFKKQELTQCFLRSLRGTDTGTDPTGTDLHRTGPNLPVCAGPYRVSNGL